MKRLTIAAVILCLAQTAAQATEANPADLPPSCEVGLMVLGIAQDAGRPQLGNPDDPAWDDATLVRLATSLGLVDTRGDEVRRWLFEATPDVRAQLQMLDRRFPVTRYVGIDGIFVTHAHMGHYTGLMHFGFEAARTDGLPVYAMPDMRDYLATNGPWSQLVGYKNIELMALEEGAPVELDDSIAVTPFAVPHRREYSETVGFRIDGPAHSAVFIPDINGWDVFDEQGTRIETLIEATDVAFLDATFYGDELPNISAFPHPKILDQMDRFDALAESDKAKIRFIHLNHSNPALLPGSPEARQVAARGYRIAEEGELYCL